MGDERGAQDNKMSFDYLRSRKNEGVEMSKWPRESRYARSGCNGTP